MSGSTSIDAPADIGIILEQIRSKHEEIKRLEHLVMKELKTEETSPMERLLQGHRLRSITESIILNTDKLVESYENIGKIKDETGDQTETWINAFSNRLEEIHEYHGKHPSGRLVDADEALLLKEEPEGFGRYLDLHDMYNQYINSNFGERVDYSAYLHVFSQPEKIPPQLKSSRQYTKYMEALLEYLICFFQRTEPLQDLDRILSKVETDFEGQENELIPSQHAVTDLDYYTMARKQSLMEAKVKKLCNLLDETIERTKQNRVKKDALTFEEMEEVEAHSKPIDAILAQQSGDGYMKPYWLNKLGLGQEYKCEICRSFSYLGKRAFERHFKEGRHEFLEIQGTDVNLGPLSRLQLTDQETEGNNPIQAPATSVAIPPPDIRWVVQKTVHILSEKGLEFERRIIAEYGKEALFHFLNRCDPYHAFYQQKLAEGRAQYQATCGVPEGITPKELDIIKLTAQFLARYGECFGERVNMDHQFEFMKPSDDARFALLGKLVYAYSQVLVLGRRGVVKEKLRESAADVETVLENCFHRLQWDRFWQRETMEKERLKRPKDDPVRGHLAVMAYLALDPPKPEPKRQKIDESDLVPEDQFLAQHPPGCATIWVCIPGHNVCIPDDRGGGTYLRIMVQSLSESVASFKQKVARDLNMSPREPKLIGKTGFLQNNQSLAHYNVGPQDVLTLYYGCDQERNA